MAVNQALLFVNKHTNTSSLLAKISPITDIRILGYGLKKGIQACNLQDFIVPSFLFIFIRKGTFKLTTAQSVHVLNSNSVYLLQPLCSYSLSSNHHHSASYAYVYFDFLPMHIRLIFQRQVEMAGDKIYRKDWYRKFGSSVNSLCKPATFNDAGQYFLVRHAIMGLIAFILHEKDVPQTKLNYLMTKKEATLTDQAYKYVSEHLKEPLNIARIAKQLGTSQSTLARVFKNSMTMTPLQALNRFKIILSIDWLKNGNSVKMTAHSFGYSSSQHYCRVFKFVTGKTTTKYFKYDKNNT